jgi:hypothetical protein
MTIETFDLSQATRPTIAKDPAATLDYSFDWTPWLTDAADSIASYSVMATGPGGATISTHSNTGGVVTAWVAGGVPGRTSVLTCHIITGAGRIDERSIWLQIRDR